ncbi:MAG: ECF transporter S component [Clostridia bacterium]|nr:ECF transporter S component [Clostridia bacterium]MBR2349200.1 ECF transporter S component [Clostridia bacterium]
MKTKSNVYALSLTALFTALIFVTTSYARVPISLGYVNLGDVFIIVGAFTLPMGYAVIAAALGGMFADLLAGYVIYMPITLVAKALMALICSLAYYKNGVKLYRYIVGAIIAGLVMVGVYFVFEGFYYGWGAAIANLPAQIIQPAITIPVGLIMIFALKKVKHFNTLKENVRFKSKRSEQKIKE